MASLSVQVLSMLGLSIEENVSDQTDKTCEPNIIKTSKKGQFLNHKSSINTSSSLITTSPITIISTVSNSVLSQSPILSTHTSNDELPIYCLREILNHDQPDDCWTVIYDRVYDITTFLSEHPGGDEIIMEYAGRDATLAFRSVGHSKLAQLSLEPFLIGILPEKERLWAHLWSLRR